MDVDAQIEADAQAVVEVLTDLTCFAGLVEIPTEDEGFITFDYEVWHDEQRQFERERTGRDVVLKPRQIGFSMLELARDLQFARTHEGTQTIVVVHSGEAKSELFSRVHTMVRSLVDWGLIPKGAAKEDTKHGIRWADTDSSIKIVEAGKDEETAKKRGRSGTIHRLHATELAFYAAPEETMTALLAASEKADVVIESTANGVGNYFHDVVARSRDGEFEDFTFHFFPWWAHDSYRADPSAYPGPPRTKREEYWEEKLRALGCDEEQLAWWRKTVQKYTLDHALREYPLGPDEAFTDNAESWLEPEWIDRLRGGQCEPIERKKIKRGEREHGVLRIYERPQNGAHYILAADPSEGVGANEAAATVIEHRTARVVAAWHHRRTKPGECGHVLAEIGRLFNTALIACERNVWRREGSEGGKATLSVLETKERYPRLYHDQQNRLGWSTNGESRPLIFGDLAKAIEEGTASNPDAKTIAEAASLIMGSDGRVRARSKRRGRGDDGLFITWGIARQVREREPMPGRVIAQAVDELESSGFRT